MHSVLLPSLFVSLILCSLSLALIIYCQRSRLWLRFNKAVWLALILFDLFFIILQNFSESFADFALSLLLALITAERFSSVRYSQNCSSCIVTWAKILVLVVTFFGLIAVSLNFLNPEFLPSLSLASLQATAIVAATVFNFLVVMFQLVILSITPRFEVNSELKDAPINLTWIEQKGKTKSN
jgi:nitrate reductase NapE component